MRKDKDRYWDCLDQAMEASHGGRIEEALAWLDEALRVHPDGAEAQPARATHTTTGANHARIRLLPLRRLHLVV